MFETIEDSYAYYERECIRYKKYQKKWFNRLCTYMKTKNDWLTDLHAMERVLDLFEDEKRTPRKGKPNG